MDILLQQQTLVNARTALVTAQHDRVVASYTVLSTVGELNSPKLGINIPLYDPMVHYQQVRDAWFGVHIPDGRRGPFGRAASSISRACPWSAPVPGQFWDTSCHGVAKCGDLEPFGRG